MDSERNCLIVGSYTHSDENGEGEVIEKEYYRQGYIFKDEDAFYNRPDEVCYIPELSDSTYNRRDFFNLVEDEKIAEELFLECDWQHPESLLEDWVRNNEFAWCTRCKKYIRTDGEEIERCSICGAEMEG